METSRPIRGTRGSIGGGPQGASEQMMTAARGDEGDDGAAVSSGADRVSGRYPRDRRAMTNNPLNEHLAELLLARIRGARHPSVTQMNLLEQIAPPRVRVEYALELMRRIEQETYPSVPMIQRVQRLVAG